MNINRYTLHFVNEDSDLEKPFRLYFFKEKLTHFRFCCIMAILFLTSWFYVDYTLYHESLLVFFIIKLILILSFCGGIIFSYAKIFYKWEQFIAGSYVLQVGFSFCLMIYLTSNNFIYPFLFGIIFSYIFNYSFIRLRFLNSLVVGLILIISYLLTFGLFNNVVETATFFVNTYFLCMLNILGLIISYSIEKTFRHEFYLLYSLNQKNKENISSLENRLYLDDMTNLYNRCAFDDFFLKRIIYCRRQSVPCTLCYLDLDQLKYVNDSYGHQEGDRYIKTLSEIILETVRNHDLAFRIGGDEFFIIFDSCTYEQSKKIIERMRILFDKKTKNFFRNFSGSFSHGSISILDNIDDSPEELIKKADNLMILNKKERRIKRGEINPASGQTVR